MARRNSELQKQINTPKLAKSRNLNTEARFLTGKEGLQLRKEAAAREAEEAEIAEAKAQKAHETEEDCQRRREANAPTAIWGGAWRN